MLHLRGHGVYYMILKMRLRVIVFCLLVCSTAGSVWAQTTELEEAQKFAAGKDYVKALELYKKLYDKTPDDIYNEYVNTLLVAKNYKEAEKLIQSRMSNNNQATFLDIDLGRVYKLEGKDSKAKEQFDNALKRVNGDDMLTQRLVKAFTDASQGEYAIQVYTRASQLMGNPYIYSMQMASIYAKDNQLDKAMNIILLPTPGQFYTPDNVKTLFLEWMGNDPKKLITAQKVLLKQINAQPDNNYYSDLLTWVYTQKNDWDGALLQMEAVDERNNENGKHLLDFGRTATNARQYDIAFKAYNEVIAKGAAFPLYVIARNEKLTASLKQLESTPVPTREAITGLMNQFNDMLVAFPQYYANQMAGDYAYVAAQYADSVDRAIEILQKAIKHPTTPKNLAGKFKLQMGDYYVLKGKVWDASLIYSQVDKDFKQDILGEDARFSNAKLAYYRGDFVWAQHMLTVLKASTSELISNDALYLSVLITENIEDSNTYPLKRFAYAGLLLFQNKDAQAGALLDSIATAFPKHPLNDDILMENSKIAEKHHEYDKAISYLATIVEKYGHDVLGDDALYKMAKIYQDYLHNKDSAKKYYEQLIIDFPGSTFVQAARQSLKEINDGATQ